MADRDNNLGGSGRDSEDQIEEDRDIDVGTEKDSSGLGAGRGDSESGGLGEGSDRSKTGTTGDDLGGSEGGMSGSSGRVEPSDEGSSNR